jgi:hypothetical protein
MCPEVAANVFSRVTFWWMNKLMKLGYEKPLGDEDVWYIPTSRLVISMFKMYFYYKGLLIIVIKQQHYQKSFKQTGDMSKENKSINPPFFLASCFSLDFLDHLYCSPSQEASVDHFYLEG